VRRSVYIWAWLIDLLTFRVALLVACQTSSKTQHRLGGTERDAAAVLRCRSVQCTYYNSWFCMGDVTLQCHANMTRRLFYIPRRGPCTHARTHAHATELTVNDRFESATGRRPRQSSSRLITWCTRRSAVTEDVSSDAMHDRVARILRRTATTLSIETDIRSNVAATAWQLHACFVHHWVHLWSSSSYEQCRNLGFLCKRSADA